MMQGNIVWKAALLTAIVFIAGIAVGIWMDNQRVDQTRERINDIDIEWNDARLTSLYYQQLAANDTAYCNAAMDANLAFNDRIYQEGLTIERYESVNRFAPELLQEKKRYALLQLQFWMNSIELKKQCGATYHTLVYFYDHYNSGLENVQAAQSAILAELKDKCGANLMLVPLPRDLDISTISLLAAQYNITSAPSILLDGNTFAGLTGNGMLVPLLGCGS